MTEAPRLRVGTRASPLALVQAGWVAERLRALHPALAAPDAAGAIALTPIKTTGDAVLDRPLADVGGKGLFSKEIDEALLDGRVDLAVHSVKDMETRLPPGIVLAAVLAREDPRDAFVSATAGSLSLLPRGSAVGSSSLRRRAQILHRRPDLRVVNVRGNIETRLGRIDDGTADAILLALAGLKRLGLAAKATEILPAEVMLPAVGQGAVGVTCRADDRATRDLLAALDDAPSAVCIAAERAMLAALDGSCRTPIGGLAELAGDGLVLRGLVARPDGGTILRTSRRGPARDAEAIGRDAGQELKRRAGPNFFD